VRWTSACPQLPTLWGEKIVLRLLDKTKLMLDMTKLGFEVESLGPLQARDREALRHRAGDGAHRLRQDEYALLAIASLTSRTPTS